MCSSLLKMRIVPPPLTVVVLVSMKSVPPAHNSAQPPVPIVLENNRTLDASSLSSSSILYLHWLWFNIYKYHFIQLWRHFVKSTMHHIPLPVLLLQYTFSAILSARNVFDKIPSRSEEGGSFRYSSMFSKSWCVARRDLLNPVKLKTQLWYFNALI